MKAPVIFALALLPLLGGPARADRWEREKSDCEQVFRGWRTHTVERLRDCVMRWEMYRQADKVDADMRAVVQEAFDKLYREGGKRDAVMALSALKRLGLLPTKLRSATGAVPRDAPNSARVVRPRGRPGLSFEPSGGGAEPAPEAIPETPAARRAPDASAAREAYVEGQRMYRAHDLPGALSEFLIAADTDPTYAQPVYMAARCYAGLKKARLAVDALRRMKAIGSETARKLVRKAARDRAFARLRGVGAFKDLTGTAVIQILNGGGEPGRATVAEYKQALEAKGMPVRAVGTDRHPRQNSYVYTKPGFEDQGEDIRRLLRLGLVHQRSIDWPSPYDVIIVHGVAGKTKYVDDEAEKAGQAAAEKKKKEEEARKRKKEAQEKERAKLRQKVQMMRMMQDMDAGDAARQADPTGGDPLNAPLPPP